jgi:hypothetical protein
VLRTARSPGAGDGSAPEYDPADENSDVDRAGAAGEGHPLGPTVDGPGAARIASTSGRAAGKLPVMGASRAGFAAWPYAAWPYAAWPACALSRPHAGRDGLGDGNGGTSETLSLVVEAMAERTEISVMRGAGGVMAATAQAPDPPVRRVTTLEPAGGAAARAGDEGRGGGRTSGSGVSEEREDREGLGGRMAGSGVNPLRDGSGARIAGSGVSDDFDCASGRMAGSEDIDGRAGGTMVPSATLRRTSLRRRPSGGEESWAVMAFFPRYAHLRTCRW